MNLYTNPQEDASIGVRQIPMAVPVVGSAGWYMKQPINYQPWFKIGFLSNNPPVHDRLPKAKEAIANFELGKRPAPE